MNLSISGDHLDVTPALRDYVNAKLDRIRRHFDQMISVSVCLSVEKLRHKARITLHARGKDLHAESTENNLYAAIDLLADKLDRQVRKLKDKPPTQARAAIKHLAEA
jgi:putative sigma-54 modulation protein